MSSTPTPEQIETGRLIIKSISPASTFQEKVEAKKELEERSQTTTTSNTSTTASTTSGSKTAQSKSSSISPQKTPTKEQAQAMWTSVSPTSTLQQKAEAKRYMESTTSNTTAPKTTTTTTAPDGLSTNSIIRLLQQQQILRGETPTTTGFPSSAPSTTSAPPINQNQTTTTGTSTLTDEQKAKLLIQKMFAPTFEQRIAAQRSLEQDMIVQALTPAQEKIIYQTSQNAPLIYTSAGRREYAIKQLETKNVLPEGYGGITTYHVPKVKTLESYSKLGYEPYQQEYYNLIGSEELSPGSYASSEFGRNEKILTGNIEASIQAGESLTGIQTAISEGRKTLEDISNAPDTATIYITELDESGKEIEIGYTREEAEKKYEEYIGGLETSYTSNKELAGRQLEFENELKRLQAGKQTIQAYQEAGYAATINEQGKLVISAPKASEVVEGIYSQEQLQGLYTAQAMRSLGAGTIGSVIQYDIVGLMSGKEEAEKIRAGEKERLAEGILGSTRQVGESELEFTGRFWTSPEVIMDVYIPLATLGAGAALSLGGKALAGTRIGTAIIQGASKSTTLVKIGSALSSTGGQVVVVGGIIAAQEAPHIIETAYTHPEMLGSTIGRATYDVGMNLAGFTVGADVGMKIYPSLQRGVTEAKTLIREKILSTNVKGELQHPTMAKIYTLPEKVKYNITPEYRTMGAQQTKLEALGSKFEEFKTDVKTTVKEPGAKEIKAEFESRGLPTEGKTIYAEEQPIKTFTQEVGDKRIIYNVEKETFTIEPVKQVGSTRPFTKEATEFKPPENKPRTGYEIKTKQEPANIDLQKQYDISTGEKTIQQKIEYYGQGKTYEVGKSYLIAEQKGYFWERPKGTITELEKVTQLKGTKPIEYGEWQGPRQKPTDYGKLKTTEKDLARYDEQIGASKKKIMEWKSKQIEGPKAPKQYELSGDTIIRTDRGDRYVTDAFTGEFKKEIPTQQLKILEADENVFAFGTARPTPPSKQFEYGEWQGPRPKPTDYNTWKMTEKEIANYEKQMEVGGQKLMDWKSSPIQRETKIKFKQEKLDIEPKTPEGIIYAGKKIEPGKTSLRFPKQTEPKLSDETIQTGATRTETILETKLPKYRTGSEYDGIETIDRSLTRQEAKILYEAEEATFPGGYKYIPKATRMIGSLALKPTSLKLTPTSDITQSRISKQTPITKKETGLGLRTRIDEQQITGEITNMRVGEMQENEFKSEQGREVESRLVLDTKQDMIVSTKQEQAQLQRQGLRQVQALAQKTELRTKIRTPYETTTKRRIKFRLEIPPQDEETRRRGLKIGKRKRIKFTTKPGKQDKGLLADWLSVTQSQARYGTATHPRLTTGTWAEAKQTGYMRVPTEELRKGGIRKNMFGNKRGNKNVFR